MNTSYKIKILTLSAIITMSTCNFLFAQYSFHAAGTTVGSSDYQNTFTVGEVVNQYHIGNHYNIKNGVIQHTTKNITASSEVSKAQLSIYPNPVEDFLFIEAQNTNATTYQIYDLKGALLQEGEMNSMISVSKLPASAYCIKLQSENISITKIFLKI